MIFIDICWQFEPQYMYILLSDKFIRAVTCNCLYLGYNCTIKSKLKVNNFVVTFKGVCVKNKSKISETA